MLSLKWSNLIFAIIDPGGLSGTKAQLQA